MLELAPEAVAPFLRTRSKTRRTEHDIARGIIAAGEAWRQSWPIPLVVDREYVGQIRYDARARQSVLTPAWRLGARDTYDGAMVARSKSAGYYDICWSKSSATRVAASWYDTFAAEGDPPAGSYGGTARTAKRLSSTTVGACAFPACSPSVRKMYRQTFFSQAGLHVICIPHDRTISYETCTMSASSQNMTNTLTAQRHISGGRGLQLSAWADTVQNATGANLTTVSYTNIGGTSGRLVKTTPTLTKGSSAYAAPSASVGARSMWLAPAAANPFIELADGDTGMTQVDSYQWNAAPTGTVNFLLSYPYHMQVSSPGGSGGGSGIAHAIDEDLMYGFTATMDLQLLDTACLGFLVYSRTTAASMDHGWLGTMVGDA